MSRGSFEDELRRALSERANSARVGPPPVLDAVEARMARLRPTPLPVPARRTWFRPVLAGGLALVGLVASFSLGRRSVSRDVVVSVGGATTPGSADAPGSDSAALPTFRIEGSSDYLPVSIEDSTVRDLRTPTEYLQAFGRFTDAGPPTLLFVSSSPVASARPVGPLPSTPVVVGGRTFAVTRGPGLARIVRWTTEGTEYRMQSIGLDERLVLSIAARARPRPIGGLDLGPPTARLIGYAEGRTVVATRRQRLTRLGEGTSVTLRVQFGSDLDWATLVADRARTATRASFDRVEVAGGQGLLFVGDTAASLLWRPAKGVAAELRAPAAATAAEIAALLRV